MGGEGRPAPLAFAGDAEMAASVAICGERARAWLAAHPEQQSQALIEVTGSGADWVTTRVSFDWDWQQSLGIRPTAGVQACAADNEGDPRPGARTMKSRMRALRSHGTIAP